MNAAPKRPAGREGEKVNRDTGARYARETDKHPFVIRVRTFGIKNR